VARGNASKDFSPFLGPKDMKRNLDIMKSKLMVGFDPLQCYLVDLEASSVDRFLSPEQIFF